MSFAGKKIFVTGGAGFIGSHIVESLVKAGATVKVYDNFSSGKRENLAPFKDDIEIVEGDILNKDQLSAAMKGCDWVSHQAAQLEITTCVEDPLFDLRVNTEGTLNVFDSALENNVSRVVSASSACVYGQARYVPEDEDHPQVPNWAYGVSKLAAERYGLVYSNTHDLPIYSLRYAIVYGEREWYGRVLTIFLKRLLKGEPPVVFGEGAQERDFTYVGDAVSLHNSCFETEAAPTSFNVSTGIGTSIKQLAQEIMQVQDLGKDILFEDVKVGEHSQLVEQNRQRLPEELEKMILSNEKAQKLLNWSPKMNLADGLKREFAWLQQNPNFWDKMSY
ncbi:MAG: NAD-dependent epimerase/dehydratase family protein [Bdellovibrionales bacterium]|nr:NAD-dependent epimerase/dehydratase family protein [Bdellovibrionales bacterium]